MSGALLHRRPAHAGLAVLVVALLALALCARAGAQEPWWHVSARPTPAVLPAGGEGKVIVVADNVGDAPARGPVTVSDELPPGVKARSVSFFASFFVFGSGFDLGPEGGFAALHLCSFTPAEVQCTFPGVHELEEVLPAEEAERFSPPVPPYFGQLEVVISVQTDEQAQGEEVDRASATGGGGSPARIARSLAVGNAPSTFGIEEFTLVPEGEGGLVDAQAGSHPFQMTTTLAFDQTAAAPYQPAQPKDVRIAMPPGLVGNTNVVPRCPYSKFTSPGNVNSNLCPPETAIGAVTVTVVDKAAKSTFVTPLFNLTPAAGELARFGFDAETVPITLAASLRTGEDYGVTIGSRNLSQLVGLIAAQVTIWGVPADSRHDISRGWGCLDLIGACIPTSAAQPASYLTLPTSCSTDFTATADADSWSRPGGYTAPLSYTLHDSEDPDIRLDGCEGLPFEPQASVLPDTSRASSPTGLTVDVRVPQQTASSPAGLVQSALRQATIVLPGGLAINPGGTDGLGACTEAEIGYLAGSSTAPQDLRFTPALTDPSCPDGSKVGTVEVKTPLLAHPLKGAMYLASQNANPFGSLIALYVLAEDPVSGTLLKLAGEVSLDPASGQMTSKFQNTPELPFESLLLHFFDGPRAPLGTPASCGRYTAAVSFQPWSGGSPVNAGSSFAIQSGLRGAPCPGPPPFAPTLVAGMTQARAGGFSPMTFTLSREDGEQELRSVRIRMPPGVSAIVSSVALCSEQQANEGTCGPDSLIGHTVVGVGLGEDPYDVTGGAVYLTGPYDGASYGLSIVTPAKAGPFDLGEVVVRATVEVDPATGALTVATDASGPHAIPRILEGIPLQVRHMNVVIDRHAFTFNPTSCARLAVEGAATSYQGDSAPLSAPFAVAGCAALGFDPKFKVSVAGRASRRDGAAVKVKITYQKGPFGSQANVSRVKVVLPKQLPSRLTTLQKACRLSVFDADPHTCPSGSRVGTATARTPILSSPLHGVAYFVSHGGAQFPELVIVLQGGGITVDLHGETFVSKAGITSSTFRTIPDLPIGTFELELPAGPHSALAANADLCASEMVMPVAFTAHSGAETHQSAHVQVTGCKPEVAIVSHRVSGATATIVAKVPSAGRLKVAGNGLSSVSTPVRKAGRATVALRLGTGEQRFLAEHPGRRLRVVVKLRFKPRRGRSISATTSVLLG